MKPKRTFNVGGTHFQGYITSTYKELVEALGKPCIEEPSEWDKVGYEWKLLFDDGTITTIYDWKRYTKTPIDPEEEFTWNVGGHSSAALDRLKEYLESSKLSLVKS